MKQYTQIYDKATDIPEEWNVFCKENIYMNTEKLHFFEEVNPCHQKYYMVYNKENELEACFVMFPFEYEFSEKVKRNVKLIFLPVSVADTGIVANPNSKALKSALKKIKGIKLILSTSEDFKLLGGVRYRGLPNCMMDIKWNTLEEYLNSMRRRYRKNIKETIKKGEKLTKRVLTNNNEFTQEMYDLYKQLMDRADYVLEILNLDFFRNSFAKTIVLEEDNKPKAFVQAIECGDKLIGEFCGFDYKDRDKYDLYKNIILAFIEYAIVNGFKTIDIGQSAESVKLKFGAYLQPKYSWIFWNGNKVCNMILKFILLRKKEDRQEYNYHVFK